MTVCVNFSPVQFLQKDLADEVAEVLEETGLDPNRLEIEVTENVLLSEPDQALAIFQTLKSYGVRIALDDFGTGFSSLSYFQRFPFDKVKIDQSFVADIYSFSSMEIIRAIIDLGRNLRIPVVAEGVERFDQAGLLGKLGCDLMQGYFYSRPKPIDQFKNIMVPKTARAA